LQRNFLLLDLYVVQKLFKIVPRVNVEYFEIFFDDEQEERDIKLYQKLFVEFRLVSFKNVENDENALLVNFEKFLFALWFVEFTSLTDFDVVKSVGHITKILEECCFTQTNLIFCTRHSDDFIQKVSKWKYNFTSLLTHYLEQSSDLKSGHVNDVKRVIFLAAVSVGLHSDKMF